MSALISSPGERGSIARLGFAHLMPALAAFLISLAIPTSAYSQGRCIRAYGTPACNTDAITPVFERAPWRTAGDANRNQPA